MAGKILSSKFKAYLDFKNWIVAYYDYFNFKI